MASAVGCPSSCYALNSKFNCKLLATQCIDCNCNWGYITNHCHDHRCNADTTGIFSRVCVSTPESTQNSNNGECRMECCGQNCFQRCNSSTSKCNLECDSVNCCQHCRENGNCDIQCHQGEYCKQQCNYGAINCSMRCDSGRHCEQICDHGECSLECRGHNCTQICNPLSIKCSLQCYGNRTCTQICNHGECTLECHGPNCKQLCNGEEHECTSKITVASVNYHHCRHHCTGEWSNCICFCYSGIA